MFLLKQFLSLQRLFLLFFPLLLFTVQACSDAPIGQNLSNSFDDPSASDSEESSPKSALPIRKISKTKTTDVSAKINRESKALISVNNTKKARMDLPIIPFTPQPYRITIKLSGANPSAPAETVTNALRKAGVRFEVEKIERVKEQSSTKALPMGRTRR